MKPITDPAGSFTFLVPDDWEATRSEGGTACAAGPGHRANVVVIAQLKQAASLDDQVKYSRAAFKRAMPSWTPMTEEPRKVSGHPAVLIRSTGNMTGVPILGEHLLVHTGQHEVTMSLSYPLSDAPAMTPAAAAIVASLQLAGSH